MRQNRQTVCVRTFGVTIPGGRMTPPQSGQWGQFVYAASGLLTVSVGGDHWFVPGYRALWAPPGREYALEMAGPVKLRAVYVAKRFCRKLPKKCCTIQVTPLLRELILHTVRLSVLRREVREERHVLNLLLDLLSTARVPSLQLPMPEHPGAAQVAAELWKAPGRTETLDELARSAGMSPRNFERVFSAQTGLGFHRWRRRLRALHALRLLSRGRPVKEVAWHVGYRTVSAFIAMFRAEFGTTPTRYFDKT